MKALLLLLCSISAALCANVQLGTCYLRGTSVDSGITGTVKFNYVAPDEVEVVVAVTGITVNPSTDHGIHVHEYGDLTDAAGASSGGHWNPASQSHACPPTVARHMGDMGSWPTSGGVITHTKTLDLLTLTGGSSIIGRAVILHQNVDDCTTQPTGNAGSRLAHCVIGIADPDADTNIAQLDDPTVTEAVCVLTPASGSAVTGLVMLTQANATAPVRVTAAINGITGPHGFHIHEYGDISGASGTLSQGHYDPLTADHHGIPPYPVRHMGDMGNIYHYDTNVAYYDYTNDMLSLSGEYSIIGRTIIVHTAVDDCSSPIGKSGSRIAQCVIGVMNPATTGPALPNGVPNTQDITGCEAIYTADGTNTDAGSNFASVNTVAFGLLALALALCALF